ncbi:MAG: penicillin-binding transpeptidase domain-containing protein [Clostridia bacterium]|nr:penicillin-binding transpeptidase domain-containing protein [Clostridia bacterium]
MNINRKIVHALIVISILFLSLIIYLTYFELFTKDKVIASSYNRRQFETEEKTLRGSIQDRNGTVLASSALEKEQQVRKYPYGPLYSHVIGYNSKIYGKSLLEAKYNDFLLGLNQISMVFGLRDKLSGNMKTGNNLQLTLDHKLQDKASKLLAGRKGAIVAIQPKTGEILAMVSEPDFDPNDQKLVKNWGKMVESKDAPFLSRAAQGLYNPGSTFKILISAAAVEKGMADRLFEDKGITVIDGKKFSNFNGEAHGKINLKTALAFSSNTVFSQVGVELGEGTLRDMAGRVGIGKDIGFDIPVSESIFPYSSMSKTDMASVGIGQGKMMVTPLHMAMIAAGVANEGQMMKPILVSKITTNDGRTIRNQKPSELYNMMSKETAAAVKEMMQEVVEKGTGRNAAIKGVKVAGKTGTAENEFTGREKNREHAWFVAFAPADKPQIAVAVVLEYSGSTGGSIAAPIARDLIAAWVKQ